MARPNSTLFCLSDSTAYGLLPTSSLVGAGSVVDTETQCVMVISCGGSLVKEGSTGKSIMELFQKSVRSHWPAVRRHACGVRLRPSGEKRPQPIVGSAAGSQEGLQPP